MNKKINLYILDFLLVILTILSILINFFYTEIFGVRDMHMEHKSFWQEYKYLFVYLSILATVIPLTFRLSKRFEWIKEHRTLVWVFIFLTIVVLSSRRRNNSEFEYINETGGIVKPAVILDFKVHSYRKHIVTKYIHDSRAYSNTFMLQKSEQDFVEIGDTVLVLFSKYQPNMSFLYKTFPTSNEIAKFKNGCYYIDGHLVDSIE